MKKLDFIEIGTCDMADTELLTCSNIAMGISMEPMKIYLDRLPFKIFVEKVNAAIVTDPNVTSVDIFYITEESISRNRLGGFLKGCNSVGKPHDLHIQYHENSGLWHNTVDKSALPLRNLVEEGLVSRSRVPCLTFRNLKEKYPFDAVDYIKLDIEGMDCEVMNDILDFYQETKMPLPKKFRFETNGHGKREDRDFVCRRLSQLNYEVKQTYDDDTIAILK